MKNTVRRSASQLARDKRRIAEMYLRGWLQVDIAKEVGLSQPHVSRSLKTLHKQWLKDAATTIEKAKARELAKIDDLERTYYEAWERSRENAESITKKQVGAGPLARKEKSQTSKAQVGNARFLSGVQWCIDRRCKILGIDAPVKTQAELSGKLMMIQLDQ